MKERCVLPTLFVLPLLLLWGCVNNLSEMSQETEAPYLNLERNNLTVSQGAYSTTLGISTNLEYEVVPQKHYYWIYYQKQEKGILLELDENQEEVSREAILYIQNEEYGIQETVTIRQQGGNSEITDAEGNDSFTDESTDSRQCIAITQKGTRCKRKAMEGSNYCWQHQP